MNNTAGRALLDANVLIYAEQRKSPYHAASKFLRDRALVGDVPGCISPQVLNEFYAIITSPNRVNEPLTAEEAIHQIRQYYRASRLTKIYPGPNIIQRELTLLEANSLSHTSQNQLRIVPRTSSATRPTPDRFAGQQMEWTIVRSHKKRRRSEMAGKPTNSSLQRLITK